MIHVDIYRAGWRYLGVVTNDAGFAVTAFGFTKEQATRRVIKKSEKAWFQ